MPRTPIHPGEHLAEELRELGISAAELSRQIDVPVNRITGIIHGQRGITADTALRLGHWFGTSPQFWMNLQQLYELRLAESEIGEQIAALPRRSNRSTPRKLGKTMSRRVKRPLRPAGDRPRARARTGARRPSAAVKVAPPGQQARAAICSFRTARAAAGAVRGRAREGRRRAAAVADQVQTVVVTADENNMRVDRFLEARFPGLSFSHIQRIVRKGELRVNGKRADSKDRIEEGQSIRIPPLKLDTPKTGGGELSEAATKTLQALKDMILYEDADVMVLNKPAGLAVQGGSGITRNVDDMLEVMRDAKGQKPRLVHRLDKETAGCLLIAKTRFAATALTGSFRHRSARKIYWALVAGVPKPKQGRISTYLAKEENEDDTIMRIAAHGDEGASHAVTYYAVVETSAQKLAWVSLKPVTGRTHQLRAHMAHIDHAIVGDPNISTRKTGSCRAVFRKGCICWRAGS